MVRTESQVCKDKAFGFKARVLSRLSWAPRAKKSTHEENPQRFRNHSKYLQIGLIIV